MRVAGVALAAVEGLTIWIWLGVGTTGCRAATPVAPKTDMMRAPALLPAPPPAGLALAGSEGRDSYGYPTRYVDQAALRSLLERRQFAELTRNLEAFQEKFEEDNSHEYWVQDAAEAFAFAEPRLLPLLNEWAAATPNSFAPYLARANFWHEMGTERRGRDWAANTTDEQFAGMHDAQARGRQDIARALELRPKLVDAYRLELASLYGEDPERRRRALDAALAVCPRCFIVRGVYMHTLVPRWGGSYEAMTAFADESEKTPNPKLRLLRGIIDADQAGMLSIRRRYPAALETISRACALGEYSKFLTQRAQIYRRLGRLDEALRDLDRSLALRPSDTYAIVNRAYVNAMARRWELSARDLLAALRLKPYSPLGKDTKAMILRPLADGGWEAHQAGRHEEAIRLLELAAQLAPESPEIRSRLATVRQGPGTPRPAPAGSPAP